LDSAEAIIASRRRLTAGVNFARKMESEGGCGVIGAACSVPIEGRYILQSLTQMKNRGNGKGGGIAAVGLSPEHLDVSERVLREDYLVQVAYLNPSSREDVEDQFINPHFEVHSGGEVPRVKDYRSIPGLEVKPPEVYRYFCRVKRELLDRFVEREGLHDVPIQQVEDEFVYQNTYELNRKFYSSLGEKKAFVLSHGKDQIVLKIVGYGDQVIKYYELEDFPAHVWIGHHRYPTKGRVWHPGGAHPFIGLNEALVHNGDFSNYYSITEYLAQRKVYPLFLTDTEVAVYLFDLWSRVYRYPLEYVIEAMAPTTERDFWMLPDEKREVYRQIQAAHIHGSPDGPWFFLVARHEPSEKKYQLLGITDTSMLRPQVFALQDGRVKIGLVASERQAINAMLRSLSQDGRIPCSFADAYWVARGGSYTDGGAFIFSVSYADETKGFSCTDKFGKQITVPSGKEHFTGCKASHRFDGPPASEISPETGSPQKLFAQLSQAFKDFEYEKCSSALEEMVSRSSEDGRAFAIEAITMLHDRCYDIGAKKRSSICELTERSLTRIFEGIGEAGSNFGHLYTLVRWNSRRRLESPHSSATLVIDAVDFPQDGNESVARFIVDSYHGGWRKFVVFNCRGHRFIGNGLGPNSDGVRIDVYGDSGDYLGSGLDGAQVHVHGSAQDQVGQIMKTGKLVVHGDVGQTFMYAAKGGEVYVLGDAAGRPLINAVGRPRVVINGTCLDYLAESFMAGDPLNGGGFAVLNGIKTVDGRLVELETPFPGGNLFSLASGGAIYVRDPGFKLEENQLNGGKFTKLKEDDWRLIYPILEENERLFGIRIEDLLTVDGLRKAPEIVYRKIAAVKPKELE
jgi:glutamate synthase domain-containing protein 1/glutamate synthase domain-containing protein 3